MVKVLTKPPPNAAFCTIRAELSIQQQAQHAIMFICCHFGGVHEAPMRWRWGRVGRWRRNARSSWRRGRRIRVSPEVEEDEACVLDHVWSGGMLFLRCLFLNSSADSFAVMLLVPRIYIPVESPFIFAARLNVRYIAATMYQVLLD